MSTLQKIRVFAALIHNQIRNRTVTVSNNVMLCSYLYTPLLERILDIKEVLYTNSSYSKSSAVYMYLCIPIDKFGANQDTYKLALHFTN